MMRSFWPWPAILVSSAIAVSLVTVVDILSPLRALVAFWFLLVCPGMAFVRLLRLNDGLAEWILAIALSLAMDAMVAISMLYAGLWSPRWALMVLIGLSVLGAALLIVRESDVSIMALNNSWMKVKQYWMPGGAAAMKFISHRRRPIATVSLVLLALSLVTISLNPFNALSTALSVIVILLLLLLLILKEIIRTFEDAQTKAWIKKLDIVILPLLLAFGLVMIVRLINL